MRHRFHDSLSGRPWPQEPLARKYVVYVVDPEVDDNLDDYC